MLYFSKGSETLSLTPEEIRKGVFKALEMIGNNGKVLVIPPDATRYHSRAGDITRYIYGFLKDSITHILPATGTHNPMNKNEISNMYYGIPERLFCEHDWRKNIITLGRVPSEFMNEVSEGKVDFEWDVQVNKLLIKGKFDTILSIGQVVPHEVIGMANYNKNILIGTGGPGAINKSHFLSAVCGIEKIMGRRDTPVRRLLNLAWEKFSNRLPRVIYFLTVIGQDEEGKRHVRGLYIGDDQECFHKASELSQQVNIEILDSPLNKIVVYLDPSEYKSTWLGNKAIYRTRMALADNGELIILAPGIEHFGEDPKIDDLIRKYGYRGREEILNAVKRNDDLQKNLSAASHLIHGSSENRFTITFCPGKISEKDIRSVNFQYADLEKMVRKYDPGIMKEGLNQRSDGEEFFFISAPGQGLWTTKNQFQMIT